MMLRPLKIDDVSDDYIAWLNDAEINRYMETRHNDQTNDSIRAFVDKQFNAPDTFLFGMFLKSDGKHIGNIKVGPVKANHLVADVSLFVGDKSCWGKGFASEAIRGVSEFGFGPMGLVKLSAVAYAANQGSVRAFLNAGYLQEGLRRKHYMFDGEPADIVEIGMTPEDLKDV